MAAAKKLPKVLQCVDPDNHLFGSTAVWSEQFGRYGVMSPEIGGHWADEAEVDGWEPLTRTPAAATP